VRVPRRTVLSLAILGVLASALVAASGAAASTFRAAVSMWHEIVSDGRAQATMPVERIVVLNAPSVADVSRLGGTYAVRRATNAQNDAIAALARAGLHLDVHERFLVALNALAVQVSPAEIAQLERAPEVRGVYQVRNVFPATVTEGALPALGAAARPEQSSGAGSDGSGVVVALLDGPVQPDHPFLTGRILPGWDAVDDTPEDVAAQTPEALQHGTATAGIVVGKNGPDGLAGVAPGARILPIQVMSIQHGALMGTTETLLAGLDRALDPNGDGNLRDHARIVLAPVAEPFASFGESPEAMAADSAERVGALLIGAAGNDGPTLARFGTIATPSAGRLWLSVGASDGRPVLPSVGAQLHGDNLDQAVASVPLAGALAPVANDALPVAVVAGPTRSDPTRAAGQPAPGDTVDDYLAPDGTRVVEGKVALVADNGAPLAAKAVAAAAAGARALAVYGDAGVPNGALGLDDRVPIPIVVLSKAQGEALAQAAASPNAASTPATISFSVASAPANPLASKVAPFSSRGLGFHDLVKPDLVAPGVAITTSLPGGGYAAVTGTSAAAAQVAGAAALLAGAHHAWTPAELRGALVGGAQVIQGSGTDGSTVEPVEAQGAGQVDPVASSSLALAADPATVSFGLVTHDPFSSAQPVTLHNLSSRPVTVRLGFQRDGVGDGASTASLSADRPRVTIPAHSEATLTLTLTAAHLPTSSSVLGGWILAVPVAGGRATRIPWALSTSGDETSSLIRNVTLTKHRIVPPAVGTAAAGTTALQQTSGAAASLSQLDIAIGSVKATSDALAIAPVAHLSVDLYKNDTLVTRVLDARSLLPGVYRYGITGRDGSGKALAPGNYRLVVDAESSDGITTERETAFVVAPPK
jgi:subtilisin family serine protease